ncbi:hypothetical protein ACP26L_16780 [Paenibacillus sp. S-38]|uniref:hypothetical protein n=1 Tax=Paenibacillus sp. S-38 TaxID=3416710 RepID=UPI003CFB4BAA
MTRVLNQVSEGTGRVLESTMNMEQTAQTVLAGAMEASAGTEQQLAALEEITASSLSLANIAEDLQSLVVKFKV